MTGLRCASLKAMYSSWVITVITAAILVPVAKRMRSKECALGSWAIKGRNWQLAANATLHLQEVIATPLDEIFSTREETIWIDWPAYPHYQGPEDFGTIILDMRHLYYVNTFKSAVSAMETGAVSAENVARLIISRLPLSL